MKGAFPGNKNSSGSLPRIFLTRRENLRAAGRKIRDCWQILQTQRFTQLIRNRLGFSQQPAISACTYTDGGLLVVRGPSGRRHSGPAPVQTHAAVGTTGSKALCGYSVEFKCQSPCPVQSPPFSSLLSFVISPSLFPPLYPSVCQGWWLAVTLCRSR